MAFFRLAALRVAMTEYIRAVNRAPVSLSEPKDKRLPMTGPLRARSAALLSMGTRGWSTKTLKPLRWFSSERSGGSYCQKLVTQVSGGAFG